MEGTSILVGDGETEAASDLSRVEGESGRVPRLASGAPPFHFHQRNKTPWTARGL